MKKVLCTLMVVLMVLTSVPLSGFKSKAESGVGDIGFPDEEFTTTGQCGDDVFWNYDETRDVLTISGTGEMWDYYYNWSPFLKGKVGSVIIEDGVTCIGEYAFHDCSTITNIQIPSSLKAINEYAFYGCRALRDISIPESVSSIANSAFSWCLSLTSITVDSNNTKYSSDSYGVMFNKDKTVLIQYPIGNERTTYTIPNSVINIDKLAFERCVNLTSVSIPNSVTNIGEEAFSHCDRLSRVTIASDTVDIGDKAFFWCDKLDVILIPDKVSIGEKAFFYTGYYLNSSNWVDGVLYLGKSLIEVNDEVVQCNLRTDMISVSEDAFTGSTALTSIDIDESSEYYSSIDGVLFNKDKTELIHYPMGKTELAYSIPNTVTHICDYAFYSSIYLVNLTMPDSVTSIGDWAFGNCYSITDALMSNSVTNIGDYAFCGCSGLTNIKIPNGVTSIGKSVFDGCDSLTSVTIGDNVTSIGNEAFWGCSSISSITIPDSVTSIGDCAFENCTSLTSITIPNSVTSIGDSTFSRCRSLTYITVDNNNTKYSSDSYGALFDKNKTKFIQYPIGNTRTSYLIPNSVTSIGDSAFWACSNLINIIIPNGVTSIKNGTFWDCSSLTSITIPDSVIDIGVSAFSGCSSLTSITVDSNNTKYSNDSYGALFNKDKTELIQYPIGNERTIYSIPDSVTSIGYATFMGCNRLTVVIIANGVASIDRFAFYGCTSLTSVTIGNSVTNIDEYAFYGCDNLTDVYYNGTKEDWNAISIDRCNAPLLNATIHFISDDPSHTHTTKTITIPASCTVDGMTYQVCSECGEPIGTPTVIPAAHTPGDWEVDIEPTYEAEGKKVKKCTVCGVKLQEESIPKLVKASVTDEETGVEIDYNGNSYSGNVGMKVTETFDGSAYQLIDTIIGTTSSKIYDIALTVDGEETQPNGKVTVKIPLPAGYNPDHSYVYHVNTKTGAVEKMPARYVDGYMVFETEHFSYYAVIEIHEHTFSGSKCTVCGYDRSDSCSCNCHKSGITKFFFNIINFFQKLFGNNKVCDCGAKH